MNAEDLLVCPACKGARLAQMLEGPELVCRGCDARFPFEDSVVDLLPGVEHDPSWAQRTMEWAPIVRIYESRLWRRNPLVERLMGIKFEDEYRLINKAGDFAGASRVLRAGGSFTAAVFRRSENGVGVRINDAWNRYIGLQEFTPQSLGEYFARAGLTQFQSLHASERWLVAQARK